MTRAIALHEASHAVVAMAAGLPVEWVSIVADRDEGTFFTAAVKIPDELIDRERDLFEICVAMAAPSFLETGDEEIDRYAEMEASLAYTMAGKAGIPPADVYAAAKRWVLFREHEIIELAERLTVEGKVVLQAA
jgi:hypothetical protein